jgi:hypothetical protein
LIPFLGERQMEESQSQQSLGRTRADVARQTERSRQMIFGVDGGGVCDDGVFDVLICRRLATGCPHPKKMGGGDVCRVFVAASGDYLTVHRHPQR